MAREDDPTKPLPASDQPTPSADQPTEPLGVEPADVDSVTDAPVIAPHVPVADVRTAQLDAAAPPPPRRPRADRVLIGVLIAVVAVGAVVFALALFGPLLSRGGTPLTPESPSPTPTPTVEVETPIDPSPDEPDPGPEPEEPAPTPEPTTPVEPTEPPVDPTPAPTP